MTQEIQDVEMQENNEIVENKDVQEIENPNDEAKKNQILEKYMARKSFKNRMSYLIALGVSLVLVVAVLVLTCVQVSVKPNFLNRGEVSHYEVNLKSNSAVFNDEHKEFDNITNALNKAFSMPLLTSIFTDQIGGFSIADGETQTTFDLANPENVLGSSNFIKVVFQSRQKVRNSNGSIYNSVKNVELNKIGEDGEQIGLTYDCFYVVLPENNEFQDLTVYIPTYGNYYKNPNFDSTVATQLKINVKANLNGLTLKLTDILED